MNGADFMQQLKATMVRNIEYNSSITENGAIGFKTTGDKIVDLNFKVSSLRNMSEEDIRKEFVKAYYDDPATAIHWLFYLGDVREGLGERRSFRIMYSELARLNKHAVINTIDLVPEYTRWDNLWCLADCNDNDINDSIGALARDQIIADIKTVIDYEGGKLDRKVPISLIAKWLPSYNTSSIETKAMAKKIAGIIGFDLSNKKDQKEYRKMLSKLRKYLNVTEIDMSTNNWGNINYESVPSRANLKYKDAFMKHDPARRAEYLDRLNKGEAKINSSVNFPHDIAHKYFCGEEWNLYLKGGVDETVENLWKALPDTVNGNQKTLVVADGSGSMTTTIGHNTSISALEVCFSLAIYFAERCTGVFRNCFITFSNKPRIVKFKNYYNLYEKLETMMNYNECSNTDIASTMALILKTAVTNKMKQSDMPANILIISDMEFDHCTNGRNIPLFKEIEISYRNAGYKLPKLIFWNVNSRTNTIPVIENELGVTLVSGFSVNICKMIMSNNFDPKDAIMKTIFSDRYYDLVDRLKQAGIKYE